MYEGYRGNANLCRKRARFRYRATSLPGVTMFVFCRLIMLTHLAQPLFEFVLAGQVQTFAKLTMRKIEAFIEDVDIQSPYCSRPTVLWSERSISRPALAKTERRFDSSRRRLLWACFCPREPHSICCSQVRDLSSLSAVASVAKSAIPFLLEISTRAPEIVSTRGAPNRRIRARASLLTMPPIPTGNCRRLSKINIPANRICLFDRATVFLS